MTTTLAEVMTWTVDEIDAKIQAILPEGWEFTHEVNSDGIPCAAFINEGFTIWHDLQIDDRLLMLNAFGFVFTKRPTNRHPAWVRGLVPGTLHRTGPTLVQTDPEDLDPEEIASVYGVNEK